MIKDESGMNSHDGHVLNGDTGDSFQRALLNPSVCLIECHDPLTDILKGVFDRSDPEIEPIGIDFPEGQVIKRAREKYGSSAVLMLHGISHINTLVKHLSPYIFAEALCEGNVRIESMELLPTVCDEGLYSIRDIDVASNIAPKMSPRIVLFVKLAGFKERFGGKYDIIAKTISDEIVKKISLIDSTSKSSKKQVYDSVTFEVNQEKTSLSGPLSLLIDQVLEDFSDEHLTRLGRGLVHPFAAISCEEGGCSKEYSIPDTFSEGHDDFSEESLKIREHIVVAYRDIAKHAAHYGLGNFYLSMFKKDGET